MGTTRKGRLTKLYLSTAFATPVWSEVKRSGDISLSGEKNGESISIRADGYEYEVTGQKKLPISFKYVQKSTSDAVFTMLLNSFLNDTPLYTAVMNGAIATTGNTGWRGAYEVKKFSESHPINGAVAYDVEMVPVEYSEVISSTDTDFFIERYTVA